MRLVQAAPAGTGAISGAPGPLSPGTLIDGRYRIISALASGSMGAVYRAEDVRLGGRPRALKEMLQYWGTQEERAEAESWFRREGETLMGLQHPAIPLVHDLFSEGGRHYLAMDLVEGRTLEQVLLEEGRPGLPEEPVVTWAVKILDVLSYLHGRPDPLIFRDLKPANVMLTPQGEIRLIDFGIARVFSRQAQGTAIGTPGYAPPEQYQGLAEPASDLYALGATMHHLLTGRDPRKSRPFDFPPVRQLAPQVSMAVAAAIDRALSLDPRARHGTAAEMRKALYATSQLEAMPRQSVSGALKRPTSASGIMAPLPSGAMPPMPVGPAGGVLDPRAVKLRPHAIKIEVAAGKTVTSIERRTVRIRSRVAQPILCAFDTDKPWLQPDRATAPLDPQGRLEVTVRVSNPPPGDHWATLRIQGGGQDWSVPVHLRSRGPGQLAAQGLIGSLSSLAALCLTIGLVSMAIGTMGMHLLSGELSWNLVVTGLVSSVVLGMVRASKGH